MSAPAAPDGFVPFAPDRVAGYRAAGYWTGRTVDALLQQAASAWPDRVAVIDAANSYSYTELNARADRAAGGFAALGITPGDRVLVQLPNAVEFAVVLFALLRAGAVPVLCLPGHRSAELDHFARVSGAVHVVDGSLAELPPGDPPDISVDTTSPALLLVSGGTTGLPKLIPRTHDDYVYNATASAELCRLTGDDVYLAVLPAAHNFPLACPGLLGAISVGAATVFTDDPSPEAAFATIARHGVTVTALVPALAKLWAQACEWEPVTPTSLRLLQVGGAKLAADDARQIRQTLTPGLQQVFGMAEGLLNFTRLDDPAELVETTQGRPLCAADEVRVVDGELLVRGPYTINGYFRDAATNAQSFTPDGFYRTGDQVHLRADGYLEVTGRIKDVIHRAGETIAAADLEQHLFSHPAITAAAAVALPDEYLGEQICAAVVFDGRPLSLAELNHYLEQRGVATHTRPDTVLAMTTLPVTPIGKIDKKAIAQHALSMRR